MSNTVYETCHSHQDQPSGGMPHLGRVELLTGRFGQSLFSPPSKCRQGHRDLVLSVGHPAALPVNARRGAFQFQATPGPAEVVRATPVMGVEQHCLKACHDLIFFQVALEHGLGQIYCSLRGLPLGQFSHQFPLGAQPTLPKDHRLSELRAAHGSAPIGRPDAAGLRVAARSGRSIARPAAA